MIKEQYLKLKDFIPYIRERYFYFEVKKEIYENSSILIQDINKEELEKYANDYVVFINNEVMMISEYTNEEKNKLEQEIITNKKIKELEKLTGKKVVLK